MTSDEYIFGDDARVTLPSRSWHADRIGKVLEGPVIAVHEAVQSKYGTAAVYVIEQSNGKLICLWGDRPINLKIQLERICPQVGDRIYVEFTHEEPGSKQFARKMFKL